MITIAGARCASLQRTARKPKGGRYVVDNRYDFDSSVAVGIGKQLHDGRVYSRPAGYRNRYGVD